jgi:hypothetical protein
LMHCATNSASCQANLAKSEAQTTPREINKFFSTFIA